jgi:hypothetical protein
MDAVATAISAKGGKGMTREEFMDIVYSELHSDGDNYRANRIIDAFDEYVEEQIKWIPVGERLPENDDYVLAWNGQPIVAYYDGEWYSNDGNFDEDISPITHWMPILKEPKEGE